MSKASDDINCTNCCIGDFKHSLCHCDEEFYAKFKGIGKMDDFIRKVMNACENTCEIERKSNANGDLISRQAVLDYIDSMPSELTNDGRRMIRRIRLTEYISDTLPSAEQNTALYIDGFNDGYEQCRQDAIDAIVAWTVEDRPHEVMPTDLVDRVKALPSAGSKSPCDECQEFDCTWCEKRMVSEDAE